MRCSSSVLPFRFTAMIVFSVDQYLRANEGRWPYDNKVTRTRYCSLGTRCISFTNTWPILNLPTLRTNKHHATLDLLKAGGHPLI